MYPIITEKGGGRFPQMFAEEFVKAYERQVAEYLRFDRESMLATGNFDANKQAAGPDLMKTQKLVPPQTQGDGAPAGVATCRIRV